MRLRFHGSAPLLTALVAALLAMPAVGASLLHVSFDITCEVFADINTAFDAAWRSNHASGITVRQSHGGSTKQARSVIDGLGADVVSMNQATDLDQIARLGKGRVPADWRTLLPHRSTPVGSTIVFLVRKGNPKGIHDWSDLAKPGVEVVFPNPRTSGNGRYSLLAAYGAELRRTGGDTNAAEELVATLVRRAPVLDTGGRAATTTFVERGVGDVLLTFEAEVALVARDSRNPDFETVVPSVSIRADFPTAVVARRDATPEDREAAQAYVRFLFTPAAREIFVRHGFRPSAAEAVPSESKPTLLYPDADFGGWPAIQERFFAQGSLLDRIQERRR